MYTTCAAVVHGYIDNHLKGTPSYQKMTYVAKDWIDRLHGTPTRLDILTRQRAKGHGDYQPGATAANTELALLRAAFRWGLKWECWNGGDPTAGIQKLKTPKRIQPAKELQIILIRDHFLRDLRTAKHVRDRALYGLMLLTGCRPIEARTAKLDAITPYGSMGSWVKGKTKNGESQELPLPSQLMPWIAAWTAIRPVSTNPYLFPGDAYEHPISAALVRLRWQELRLLMSTPEISLESVWNYDLRKTLVDTLGNKLGYDVATIRAILNHTDTSALGHYYAKSFDSLTKPMQHYADWLWGLQA